MKTYYYSVIETKKYFYSIEASSDEEADEKVAEMTPEEAISKQLLDKDIELKSVEETEEEND